MPTTQQVTVNGSPYVVPPKTAKEIKSLDGLLMDRTTQESVIDFLEENHRYIAEQYEEYAGGAGDRDANKVTWEALKDFLRDRLDHSGAKYLYDLLIKLPYYESIDLACRITFKMVDASAGSPEDSRPYIKEALSDINRTSRSYVNKEKTRLLKSAGVKSAAKAKTAKRDLFKKGLEIPTGENGADAMRSITAPVNPLIEPAQAEAARILDAIGKIKNNKNKAKVLNELRKICPNHPKDARIRIAGLVMSGEEITAQKLWMIIVEFGFFGTSEIPRGTEIKIGGKRGRIIPGK